MNFESGPSQFDEAWARVREVTGWAGYKELADFVGSSAQSISGVKKRGKFTLEWARKIAQDFNSFTDYIMDGAGPRRRDRGWAASGFVSEAPTCYLEDQDQLALQLCGVPKPEEQKQPKEPEAPPGYVRVPRYQVAASAGGGSVVRSEQIVDHLAFREDWVRLSLGVSPSRVAVISVIGDSMHPHLEDGDLILVDLGVTHYINDAVYVLQYDDALLVKRMHRKEDGTMVVKGDNPSYDPWIMNTDQVKRLRVVARMLRRLVR